MAESKPQSLDANQEEEEGINAVNLLGKAEEEIESVLQKEISSSKEEADIDDTSIINTHDVKAPNLFDRAKEEITAIVQTILTKKDDNQLEDTTTNTTTRSVSEADSLLHGKFEKVVNLIERGKEEMVAILSNRKEKSGNQGETHGLRDDIDENTPLSEVKGPTIFERAKEEFEAIVNVIHPKKESTTTRRDNIVDAGEGPSSSSSDGFWVLVGRQLEKFCCSPFDGKKD